MRRGTVTPWAAAVLAWGALAGCAGSATPRDDDFHTSGSRQADQRAEQRIVRTQQLRGEAVGAEGEDAEVQLSLYERLGGAGGVARIVDDFVDRAVADPRVNWERKGHRRGGVLGIGGEPVDWRPTAANLTELKRHLAEFVAVATGGPTRYTGRDMKEVHAGMGIANSEFDAAIGDLKASLDALRVGTPEQKELLSVLESARPQVVEER